MNCNICNLTLIYEGSDCYACPEHGWDWMMSPLTYCMEEFNITKDEAESMIRSSNEVKE